MTLDSKVQFTQWWDDDIQSIVMIASNGYTVARCDCSVEDLRSMSAGELACEKKRAAKIMIDDLHWRTPLAYVHRGTDGA